jgi:predicted ABC-type ATPase
MRELFLIAGAKEAVKRPWPKNYYRNSGWNLSMLMKLLGNLILVMLTKLKIAAGKMVFTKIDSLVSQGRSFAIETTLSGQYLVRFIKNLKEKGYVITLIYVFLDNPELAIDRIKVRVRTGGHFVPDQDVRRRFYPGKKNFWNIYKDLADYWEIYYNGEHGFIQVVTGEKKNMTIIDETLFELFKGGLD